MCASKGQSVKKSTHKYYIKRAGDDRDRQTLLTLYIMSFVGLCLNIVSEGLLRFELLNCDQVKGDILC